ncbi:hypothetical protein [Aliarcobacter cryaerophilus]|jgi:hypothetical protein|uniref:hypothetical protein n=1 Tax=Aliarcobacter cryaerophilus TaxID=28198 RepID=UPI003DA6598A
MSYSILYEQFYKQFDWTEWYNNKCTRYGSKVIYSMSYGMFILHHLIVKYNVKDKEETLKLIEEGVLDNDKFFIDYKTHPNINKSTQSIYYSLLEYLI